MNRPSAGGDNSYKASPHRLCWPIVALVSNAIFPGLICRGWAKTEASTKEGDFTFYFAIPAIGAGAGQLHCRGRRLHRKLCPFRQVHGDLL